MRLVVNGADVEVDDRHVKTRLLWVLRASSGFLISGLGLALAFIPMSIGALTGVRPEEAGVASGLINTSQQIGGAIGVAIATTVATSFTRRYVDDHAGSNAFSGPALTHGFQIAFYVLAGLAAAGALISVLMLESRPGEPELQPTSEAFELEEA
jgi:MFS family permease